MTSIIVISAKSFYRSSPNLHLESYEITSLDITFELLIINTYRGYSRAHASKYAVSSSSTSSLMTP